jgi:hypothetical protein
MDKLYKENDTPDACIKVLGQYYLTLRPLPRSSAAIVDPSLRVEHRVCKAQKGHESLEVNFPFSGLCRPALCRFVPP